MLIVEYRTDEPFLKEALERAPDLEITVEEIYVVDDTVHYLVWAECGDVDAFEAGIEDDPTATDPRTLAETPSRRLYRVATTEVMDGKSMAPEIRDLDLVTLEASATHEGWTTRMRVPDRDALAEFRSAHREQGFPFELRSVYRETDDAGAPSVVTEAQREALVAAHEAGHYDVPQEASQEAVAEGLGIAPQSLSERLRRGTAAIVETVLVPGGS